MRNIFNFKNRLQGLQQSVIRFPLTVIFLIAFFATSAWSIETTESANRLLFSLGVGILASILVQVIYETYFKTVSYQLGLYGIAVMAAIGYYLVVPDGVDSIVVGIRTTVLYFVLIVGILTVPALKKRLSFQWNFLKIFQAFFLTVLFTAVLVAGTSSILLAFDSLLFSIPERTYAHAVNAITTLFSPIFFLSYLPKYTPQIKKEESNTTLPRSLEILVSYVIIPLLVLFTLILIVYLAINIREEFWTDNLIEPMLISYAIIGLLTYVLASTMKNPFTHAFIKYYPIALIVLMLFQTISSSLRIQETGVTYGRYYVILVAVFLFLAGIHFLVYHRDQLQRVMLLLIGLAILSITPPIDAFTTSKWQQTNRLEELLISNQLLQEGTLTPQPEIPSSEKEKITETVFYLQGMEWLDEFSYIPLNDRGDNFEELFGFKPMYTRNRYELEQSRNLSIDWERFSGVEIEGYDYFTQFNVGDSTVRFGMGPQTAIETEKYQLKSEQNVVVILDKAEEELMRVNMIEVFEEFFTRNQAGGENISVEELTWERENEKIQVKLVVQHVNEFENGYYAEGYLLIGNKE
ncbi:DUF4153 domain-containing protein [Lacticigenium naphthae]|uniref:DUF4153 domain-containing protein n=1 Tax=Lacticigenium naphthae TaxID=515351 RepID=UPI0003F7E364|nr:DUF4153 domain-containing protein [Lacticigenium naphthae]